MAGQCRKYGFDGEPLLCFQKRRAKDSYTPGGEMGKRPDYATIVYSNLIRTWSKKPIILGGIEASLRRLAHYDYWSGKMKFIHSAGFPGRSDFLRNGAKRSIVEIADALASGIEAKDITFIEGTVYKADNLNSVYDEIRLPSYREVSSDKKTYAESFTPSTAIRIHFQENVSLSRTATASMWFRIRRRSR